MVRRNQKNAETIRQTIVTNLEAPRLTGVSTKEFVKFKKARELYEQQVEEKNREPGVSIVATSYKASIESALLRIMIAAEWVPVKSIDEITEEHLISCVEAQAVYKPSNYEAERIDDIVADIKMDTSVKDSSSRVWTFYQRYLTRLENHGIGDLPDANPQVVIKQLLNKVEPEELRLRMKAIAFWQKASSCVPFPGF